MTHRRKPITPTHPPPRHPDYVGLKLTPTEERLLRVLCDGLRHTKKELAAAALDDAVQYGPSALRKYICTLRDKLRPLGQGIVCLVVWHYRYYQLVRFINPEAAYEPPATPDALGPTTRAPAATPAPAPPPPVNGRGGAPGASNEHPDGPPARRPRRG
jgi:hypothetical protein